MTDLTREKIAETILDGLCDRFPDMDNVRSGDEETWRGIVDEVVGALPAASLSAGEPDGMETTAEERKRWRKLAHDEPRYWIARGPLVGDMAALFRDFDRLLAREAKAFNAGAKASEDACAIQIADLIRRMDDDALAREAKAREEERERAAKIVRGNIVHERYITWPRWNPMGNVHDHEPMARLTKALADAILESKP